MNTEMQLKSVGKTIAQTADSKKLLDTLIRIARKTEWNEYDEAAYESGYNELLIRLGIISE